MKEKKYVEVFSFYKRCHRRHATITTTTSSPKKIYETYNSFYYDYGYDDRASLWFGCMHVILCILDLRCSLRFFYQKTPNFFPLFIASSGGESGMVQCIYLV